MRISGWLTIATLLVPVSGFGFQAQFGLSPDNSRELLLSTIGSAKHDLVINIYQFEDAEIAAAVASRIEAGVNARILIEGEPFGQISPEGKKVLRALQKAMKSGHKTRNQLFLMTSAAGGKRRFHFDHAKYLVIDGATVVISSENFSSNGFPHGGTEGNRGWQVVLGSTELANQMLKIFASDTDLSKKDVLDITNSRMDVAADAFGETQTRRTIRPIPSESGSVSSFQVVSSPDSLPGMTDLLKSAHRSVSVQFMSLPSTWRENGQETRSTLVSEIVNSASRGAQVEVLLNDENAFGGGAQLTGGDSADSKKQNEITVEFLNQTAKCRHLALEGRIVDIRRVQITYIHNKGILVDGKRAFVSSVNGTRNSIMDNREIGIVLESPDAADYFGRAFAFDWDSSAKMSSGSARCMNDPLTDAAAWQKLPFLE